jgi:hypothetical protein
MEQFHLVERVDRMLGEGFYFHPALRVVSRSLKAMHDALVDYFEFERDVDLCDLVGQIENCTPLQAHLLEFNGFGRLRG